jgi:hypothetical protein
VPAPAATNGTGVRLEQLTPQQISELPQDELNRLVNTADFPKLSPAQRMILLGRYPDQR